MKNWKTTLAGALALALVISHAIWPAVMTTELATGISSVLVAAGLLVAKDGNVTGGTVLNSNNDASIVKQSAKEDK
jgi:hypothetical protein